MERISDHRFDRQTPSIMNCLSNTRVHILQASVARRDRMLAACGSGDARQRRPPCQSGTPPCWQAALRSGRVTTSAAARSRRVDRARRRGMNSCQYRCPSWQWSDWICWTWLCSFDCQPLPASRRGGAGARPDHSISRSYKYRTADGEEYRIKSGPRDSRSGERLADYFILVLSFNAVFAHDRAPHLHLLSQELA